jgi:hypothetical protein
MPNKLLPLTRLEKEILDRYLDVVLKGNKDGLKVIYRLFFGRNSCSIVDVLPLHCCSY